MGIVPNTEFPPAVVASIDLEKSPVVDQKDITQGFLKHDDVTLKDIRKIGKSFFGFLKSSGMKEKFVNLDGDKLYLDFVFCTVEALVENDTVFDNFNETQKHITNVDLNDLKGDDLKNTLDYSMAFIQKTVTTGFFSNMTSLFLNAIKG